MKLVTDYTSIGSDMTDKQYACPYCSTKFNTEKYYTRLLENDETFPKEHIKTFVALIISLQKKDAHN